MESRLCSLSPFVFLRRPCGQVLFVSVFGTYGNVVRGSDLNDDPVFEIAIDLGRLDLRDGKGGFEVLSLPVGVAVLPHLLNLPVALTEAEPGKFLFDPGPKLVQNVSVVVVVGQRGDAPSEYLVPIRDDLRAEVASNPFWNWVSGGVHHKDTVRRRVCVRAVATPEALPFVLYPVWDIRVVDSKGFKGNILVPRGPSGEFGRYAIGHFFDIFLGSFHLAAEILD